MGKRLPKTAICLFIVMCLALSPVGALAAAKTVSILKVEYDYTRLRSEPTSSSGEIITTLRKDAKVFYIGRSGSWAYVCTEWGTMGYLYSGYLSYYGKVRLGNIYYVNASSLKVYKSASTSSTRIGTLPKNYYLLLYATNGNWGYVRSLSGNAGYVLLSGLKRLSS